VACFVGVFDCVFWIGWLGSAMKKYNYPISYFGYAYGGMSFMYLIFCLIFIKIEHLFPRRLVFVIGFLGMGGCILMMGPSKMLGFP
jgi:hypothetical protein